MNTIKGVGLMEIENDNSIYYQSVQKHVSLTVAYLIGTKMELLVNYNPNYTKQIGIIII